jgi:hypothetical protein
MVSAKFFHPAVATKLSHHDAKACGVRVFSQLRQCRGFIQLAPVALNREDLNDPRTAVRGIFRKAM